VPFRVCADDERGMKDAAFIP